MNHPESFLSLLRNRTGKFWRKPWHIWVWALALSVLLHILLLKGIPIYLPPMPRFAPPALHIRLIPTLPVPPHPRVNQPTLPHPLHRHSGMHHAVTPHPAVRPVKHPVTKTQTIQQPAPSPLATTPSTAEHASAGSTTSAVSSATTTPASAIHTRHLPDHIELQYHIYLGEGGVNIGHASYAWIQDDNRYALASIVQADGLLALFQSGRLTQISTGHISQGHLLPDDFEIQRGSDSPNATTHIHIDHTTQLATVTRRGNTATEPAPDGAQDILSIIFELALRAPFTNTITLPVSSGKAFKPYHAAIVGEETITTPLGSLHTLHITRSPENGENDEDGMDIWLDENRHYLPVKIRLHDGQLGWIVQVATSVSIDTRQKVTP